MANIPEWNIAAQLEDKSLLEKLEKKTHQKRSDLFFSIQRGRQGFIKAGSQFTMDQLFQAFLMRLEGKSSSEILTMFGKESNDKNSHLLAAHISQKFSKKARSLLPRNRERTKEEHKE